MAEYSGLNRKYLRVQDLRRLRNVFFSSRRAVEGQYAGRHASPQRGHSVEFNDYRQYMPGDEIGDIDWKVFGRTDKMFLKLFEHQSDMAVNLVVDCSASMAYAGLDGAHSKYDHACMMAAAIAFLTTQQQDKVSLSLACEGLGKFHRPHGAFTHLVGILQAMEDAKPSGKAKLSDALRKAAALIGRKGLLVVFSDFLDDLDEIFGALSIYSHRGSEIIVFHVLHADELKLPDVGAAAFQDSESNQRVAVNVQDVRQAYDARLQKFLNDVAANCRGRGMDYNLVSTATSYNRSLEQYLFQRASMA
jgi:uncharacterized protein (DUF58 family)